MSNTNKTLVEFEAILDPFKKKIERGIQESFSVLGEKNALREACEYALLNGGKRIRPALVLMIANALGHKADVLQAALAVEYFHTASLIADDLPCMDNDDMRRDNPSVHKVYGESIALLASYALIAEGYRCLAKNAELLKKSQLPFAPLADRICTLALENATENTGIFGATGGQFLDLFPPKHSLEAIEEVIKKKTVSLFEISFVLGWLFGGGSLEQIDAVKKSAYHFGMAFQIADDLSDFEQDSKQEKTSNLAIVFGVEKAKKMFHEEITRLGICIQRLNITIPELYAMNKVLVLQVES